jgi:hypothetical protein
MRRVHRPGHLAAKFSRSDRSVLAIPYAVCTLHCTAGNGPDFDSDLSRNVNLLRLIAFQGNFDLA